MRGSILMFVAGVAIAILAVFLMNQYFGAQNQGPVVAQPQPSSVPVVITRVPISFGTPIREDFLVIQQWPEESRPAASFASVAELVGDGTEPRVALRDVQAGEPLLQPAVSGFGERASMSTRVNTEMRAVSIRINDVSGVAGFTLPGDRVDILLTRDDVTDVILQNVTVLGIDQLSDQQRDQPVVARTATVEVDTEQAQKLALAQQLGALSFALRNAEMIELENTRRIRAGDLVGPALGPPPPPPPTVRVRRGGEGVTAQVVPN
jgi:pilus assembly protein CpaB